jgi:hydroxypyruvate reductase
VLPVPRASGRLRADARAVFDAAVAAVDPFRAVHRNLALRRGAVAIGGRKVVLGAGARLVAVAVGKAAAPMMAAAETVLGDRLAAGLCVTKRGYGRSLSRARLLEAGHPVPDEVGLAAAGEVESLLAGGREGDLVLVLISGGGSALLPAPAQGVTLAEKQAVTSLLLASGADIAEMNCVRKHLSRLKGGGLCRRAAPARVATLVLSDVVGDPLDVVASGPTVPDPTTFSDALAVLDRRGLRERVPPAALARLEAGARGEVPETPKPGDPVFRGGPPLLVGSNRIAVEAGARRARSLGYRPLVLSTSVTGEAREVAQVLAAVAREARASGRPARPPCCLLSGGEPTVTLRGGGKGGRSQELALSAALALEGVAGVALLSAGTDGTDGPTDAAGAICDGDTAARARALGLDPRRHLDGNDAYPLFAALGDLVVTGPTQTNVMDLHVIAVGGRRPPATGRRRSPRRRGRARAR